MNQVAKETEIGKYNVDLEVFNGPLDLLLYLIRKEEVDIYDIPVANITKQYLTYIEMMKTLSLEVAGEFILMAATLIRIKTRWLLPRDEEDLEEVDPREELIMALVEYRKYKEAGNILRDRALEEERVYVPPSPTEKIEGRVDLSPATTLFDLVTAFREVMNSRPEVLAHEVNPETSSVEERIPVIMKLVGSRDGIIFVDLFKDIPTKIIAIVTFIALLELARSRRIVLGQSKPFADLRVYRGENFDAVTQNIDLVEMSEELEQAGSQ